MGESINVKEFWKENKDTEMFSAMMRNLYTNLLISYLYESVFAEFRFSDRMKYRIEKGFFDLIIDTTKDCTELRPSVLSDRLKDIIKSECKNSRFSKKRIEDITDKLETSMDINGSKEEDVILLLKSRVLKRLIECRLFEMGYTTDECDVLTPDLDYIYNQIKD